MNLVGSKGKMVADLMEQLGDSFENEYVSNREEVMRYLAEIIDTLEKNYQMVSFDEEFQKNSSRSCTIEKSFLTPEANYYINIKGGTFAILAAVANYKLSGEINPVLYAVAQKALSQIVPGFDNTLFYKLNSALGESCIMVEAAMNGKKGINQSVFAANHGECVNNHLWCGFRREEHKCICTRENVKTICENLEKAGLLTKKGAKYYYQDIF